MHSWGLKYTRFQTHYFQYALMSLSRPDPVIPMSLGFLSGAMQLSGWPWSHVEADAWLQVIQEVQD